MIELKQALEIVCNAAHRVSAVETLEFHKVLGMTLADDIFAPSSYPPFSKSAMDGFACRAKDQDKPMNLVGECAAGEISNISLGPGECLRIMTGAPVPEGANMVVRVEYTELDGKTVCVHTHDKQNIIKRGEERITGTKFRSNETFTKYRIEKPIGQVQVPDEIEADSTEGQNQ